MFPILILTFIYIKRRKISLLNYQQISSFSLQHKSATHFCREPPNKNDQFHLGKNLGIKPMFKQRFTGYCGASDVHSLNGITFTLYISHPQQFRYESFFLEHLKIINMFSSSWTHRFTKGLVWSTYRTCPYRTLPYWTFPATQRFLTIRFLTSSFLT